MAQKGEQSGPSEDVSHIWKEGTIRLFISHRDEYKRQARELADELGEYGISSFVAHESIEAGKQWQDEIVIGLKTMDVMLALITDDFVDSVFCNQEVGFALGKGIPVTSIKLENADPPGFISSFQALRGNISDPASSVGDVFKLVADAVGQGDKVVDGLLQAFVEAPSFIDAQERFNRLADVTTSLTRRQVKRLVAGFNQNNQLYGCYYLRYGGPRITTFLHEVSDRSYDLRDHQLVKTS